MPSSPIDALLSFTDRTRLYRRRGQGALSQLLVESWRQDEALDAPWRLHIDALGTDATLDVHAMLGQPVTLHTRLSDGSEHPRAGLVMAAQAVDSDGGLARNRLQVEPSLGLLAHNTTSRVWQDKHVTAIIDSVLSAHPQAAWACADCIEPHLAASANAGERSYTVQYRETDLDFLHRVLAREAIAYRIEPHAESAGGHRVVFFADSVSKTSCPEDGCSKSSLGGQGIRYHQAAGGASQEEQDAIQAFGGVRRLVATRVVTSRWDHVAKRLVAGCAGPPGRRRRHRGAAGAARRGACASRQERLRQPLRSHPRGQPSASGHEQIHIDRQGRVRIQFDFQRLQPGEQSSNASTWVRALQRWAGAGMGAQFMPRLGQQVLVDFIDGDIERPLVLGSLYDGKGEAGEPAKPGGRVLAAALSKGYELSTDALPGAQANLSAGHSPAWHGHSAGDVAAGGQANAAALSGYKSAELANDGAEGAGYNQLVFDDTNGQLRTQLATTQHATQLNRGHLIHQADNHRGSFRGLGFELRSDAYGAVRASQGVLISSYATQAHEPAGDNAPGIALQGQPVQLSESLSQAAKTHQTVALASHLGSLEANQAAMSEQQPPAKALHTAIKGMVNHLTFETAQSDAAQKSTAPDPQATQRYGYSLFQSRTRLRPTVTPCAEQRWRGRLRRRHVFCTEAMNEHQAVERQTASSASRPQQSRAMKLRVLGVGSEAAPRMPSLMLSPSDGAWCRVDAARGITHHDDGATVVLTGMRREQVSGLLDLRDGAPIDLYATPAVFEHLTLTLPLLPVLQQFCGVQWHLIAVGGEQRAADFTIERFPTLTFTALTAGDGGERIALAVRDERSRARLFFVHGASLDSAAFDWMNDWMQGADCVVIDRATDTLGTRWLDCLAQLPATRKLLLDAYGCDRAAIAASGIECAQGAMEFEL